MMRRDQFEAFILRSRGGRGIKKMAELLDRLPDDTYAQDHVQRHWWTWQQAIIATQLPSWETAEVPIVQCINDRQSEQK